MMTKELLKMELDRRKIKRKELASILGISAGYVSDILRGKKNGQKRIFEFAEKLGVDLFDKMAVPRQQGKPIPVISCVDAGRFKEAVDLWPMGVSGEAEPVFSYHHAGPNAFGLRVRGDSMVPRYLDGDIIIVDPDIRCDNGCPCVVWLNEEVSFKFFWDSESQIRLQPMNDKYPEIIIKKDSRVDFRVIGKVIDMKPKL